MKKTLTLVIPVFNEERNLRALVRAIQGVMRTCENYEWSILFVDDGSSDGSIAEIERISKDTANIGYIELSRNFGKEVATTAGLHEAMGDAVMLMDADLQHPPERIPDFIKKWEEGFDVVVGVRDRNQGEGFIKHVGSKLYYQLMGFLSETVLVPGETDFRLIDRKVIEAFKQFTERNRMTRALLNWLGFKRAEVVFTANARQEGKAGYSPAKLTRLALASFISHSLFPLKFAGYLGVLIMLGSGLTGLFIFYVKYIAHDPWQFNFSGPASLAVVNTFLVGLVLACLGLVALYIGTIHAEVANRPLYIIRTKK